MSRLAVATYFLIAAGTGAVASSPGGAGEVLLPSLEEIAQMESGWQLDEALRTVGVVESAALNREARVSIRDSDCSLAADGAAACTYESSRCLNGEQPGADGWCLRTSRFVRTTEVPPGLTSAGGWTLERPRG